MKARDYFQDPGSRCLKCAQAPDFFLSKQAINDYFLKAKSTIPCCGFNKFAFEEARTSSCPGPSSLDLDMVLATIGFDNDPKTASIAISTEDDLQSLNEPWMPSAKSPCVTPAEIQLYALQQMATIPFPIYGMREVAIQTDTTHTSPSPQISPSALKSTSYLNIFYVGKRPCRPLTRPVPSVSSLGLKQKKVLPEPPKDHPKHLYITSSLDRSYLN